MFVVRAIAYFSEVPFRCSTFWGKYLASPANIRLSWKGLPGTNTLAYYEKVLLTVVKSFITLAPDEKCYEMFCDMMYTFKQQTL